MVYFFQARVLFSIENVKGWPILAIWLQVYAPFGVLLQGGGVPKLTNVCYALGSSESDKRVSMIELRMRNLFM